MAMPSVPPSSSSTDKNSIDMSTLSTHIESLRTKFTPIIENPGRINGDRKLPKPLLSKINELEFSSLFS